MFFYFSPALLIRIRHFLLLFDLFERTRLLGIAADSRQRAGTKRNFHSLGDRRRLNRPIKNGSGWKPSTHWWIAAKVSRQAVETPSHLRFWKNRENYFSAWNSRGPIGRSHLSQRRMHVKSLECNPCTMLTKSLLLSSQPPRCFCWTNAQSVFSTRLNRQLYVYFINQISVHAPHSPALVITLQSNDLYRTNGWNCFISRQAKSILICEWWARSKSLFLNAPRRTPCARGRYTSILHRQWFYRSTTTWWDKNITGVASLHTSRCENQRIEDAYGILSSFFFAMRCMRICMHMDVKRQRNNWHTVISWVPAMLSP